LTPGRETTDRNATGGDIREEVSRMKSPREILSDAVNLLLFLAGILLVLVLLVLLDPSIKRWVIDLLTRR
jgi:hypothetical protein